MGDPRQSPAMQQYYRFKRQHPGCVLLLRIGDFYECFDDDAVAISKAIGLTLTKRTEGVPMAGVPYHQIDTYLKKLVQAGFRVAVADQTEDAAKAKGLVKREVTQVVTPGTLVDSALLDDDAGSTIAAVCFTEPGDDSHADLAVIDASTGDFCLARTHAGAIIDELARRRVKELLYADAAGGPAPPRVKRLLAALSISGTPRPAWHFRAEEAREAVLEHFRVSTLAGFGLQADDASITPAGALLRYLKETQTPSDAESGPRGDWAPRGSLAHLRPPRLDSRSAECVVDAVSLRALEVERVMRAAPGSPAADDRSLVGLFLGAGNKGVCFTAMGKRLLRDWLVRPLGKLDEINARQNAVSLFVHDRRVSGELARALDGIQDVARIVGRLALDRASPRDVVALGLSLSRLTPLAAAIDNAPAVAQLREALLAVDQAVSPCARQILTSCVESPPPHLREGGVFKDGVDEALDQARLLQKDAGAWLAAYQERLAKECDLPGLKVGYNRIFGYYIELPQAQSKRAPALLERKQTLKNAERYTTPELREFERNVTTAESRALERERELFRALCDSLREQLEAIQSFADAAAALDALQGLAERAVAKGWKRPDVVAEPTLKIDGGRHPVLEELLGRDFVPNDIALGGGGAEGDAALALITGPNMAGKSTFIRQVALIVLLAHAGSFVPADRAVIGLCDRIFTRIGADDALHAGQSTFMVEMTETANILNHATPRSLVVLDEIGRGTSTYDGLSLAWAVAEFLAATSTDPARGPASGPRTLFATHYHELTELQDLFPAKVKNLHVAVREWAGEGGHPEIVFLHRILPGRTDQSYGIHVARLAGLPAPVIARARDVLASLSEPDAQARGDGGGANSSPKKHHAPASPAASREPQLSLFTEFLQHPAISELKELKLDTLTPVQAFDHIRRLKDLADKK